MSTELTIPMQQDPLIDGFIEGWLSKRTRRSERTQTAYSEYMADFRRVLWDTERATLQSDPDIIADTAEKWANSSKVEGKTVAPATFNLRLAAISSFYVYLIRQGKTRTNPIARIERPKMQAYARAMPLDTKDVARRLKAIDRTTLQGKRDYALLTVLTATGRRLSEVANMKRGDLVFGPSILVSFPHCKGDKPMSDRLTVRQSDALIDYLNAMYGEYLNVKGAVDLASIPFDAPIWVSVSKRNAGKALGVQTVADICQKHLGTSKVHTLRHTFAVAMEQSGAPLSEIQKRLGHESAATTSIYLERLQAADNPYAAKLDDLFGIGD